MPNPASSEDLVRLIQQKRTQVEAFLATARPRKRRLLNTTIVGGSLAAALTAGPAVGGQSFTVWLTGVLGLTSPSWRILCGAASICSVLATVATYLAPGGHALMLVKPQFELQPADIGKGGLVKSAASYPVVETRIREACAALSLEVRDYFASIVTGADGNREFFVWATAAT